MPSVEAAEVGLICFAAGALVGLSVGWESRRTALSRAAEVCRGRIARQGPIMSDFEAGYAYACERIARTFDRMAGGRPVAITGVEERKVQGEARACGRVRR
jgi:hypothetical protein